MLEIPGQDLAGKWNGYLTVENDTLTPELARVFGEMIEGWAESAGCETTEGETNGEKTIGKVLECTIEFKAIADTEGKYQAFMKIKDSGSSSDKKPVPMEASLNGDEVQISGVVEFLNGEFRGKLIDKDNIEGSFSLKIIGQYAAQLKIKPDAGMDGGFRAVRIKN